ARKKVPKAARPGDFGFTLSVLGHELLKFPLDGARNLVEDRPGRSLAADHSHDAVVELVVEGAAVWDRRPRVAGILQDLRETGQDVVIREVRRNERSAV